MMSLISRLYPPQDHYMNKSQAESAAHEQQTRFIDRGQSNGWIRTDYDYPTKLHIPEQEPVINVSPKNSEDENDNHILDLTMFRDFEAALDSDFVKDQLKEIAKNPGEPAIQVLLNGQASPILLQVSLNQGNLDYKFLDDYSSETIREGLNINKIEVIKLGGKIIYKSSLPEKGRLTTRIRPSIDPKDCLPWNNTGQLRPPSTIRTHHKLLGPNGQPI